MMISSTLFLGVLVYGLKLLEEPLRPLDLFHKLELSPALPLLLHTLRVDRPLLALLRHGRIPFDQIYLEDFGNQVHRKRYKKLMGSRDRAVLIPSAGLSSVRFRVGSAELQGLRLFDDLSTPYMPPDVAVILDALRVMESGAMVQCRDFVSLAPSVFFQEPLSEHDLHWSLFHYSTLRPVSCLKESVLIEVKEVNCLLNASYWVAEEEIDDPVDLSRYALHLLLVVLGMEEGLRDGSFAQPFQKEPLKRLETIKEALLPGMRAVLASYFDRRKPLPSLFLVLDELEEATPSRWTLALIDLYHQLNSIDWDSLGSLLVKALEGSSPLEVSYWVEKYLEAPDELHFTRQPLCRLIAKCVKVQTWILSTPSTYPFQDCVPFAMRLKTTRSVFISQVPNIRKIYQIGRRIDPESRLDLTRFVERYWESVIAHLAKGPDGWKIALLSAGRLSQASFVLAIQVLFEVPSIYRFCSGQLEILFGYRLLDRSDPTTVITSAFPLVELMETSALVRPDLCHFVEHANQFSQPYDQPYQPVIYHGEVQARLEKAVIAARSVLGYLLSWEEIQSLI